jgi:hypothetical protein
MVHIQGVCKPAPATRGLAERIESLLTSERRMRDHGPGLAITVRVVEVFEGRVSAANAPEGG